MIKQALLYGRQRVCITEQTKKKIVLKIVQITKCQYQFINNHPLAYQIYFINFTDNFSLFFLIKIRIFSFAIFTKLNGCLYSGKFKLLINKSNVESISSLVLHTFGNTGSSTIHILVIQDIVLYIFGTTGSGTTDIWYYKIQYYTLYSIHIWYYRIQYYRLCRHAQIFVVEYTARNLGVLNQNF